MKRLFKTSLLLIAVIWPITLCVGVSSEITEDWRMQYNELEASIKSRGKDQGPEDQMLDRSAMILISDRTPVGIVIRRAQVLLAHMNSLKAAPDLRKQEELLAKLVERAGKEELDRETATELFIEVGIVRFRDCNIHAKRVATCHNFCYMSHH